MSLKKHLSRIAMPAIRLYWRIFKPRTYGVKVLIRHPHEHDQVLLVLHTYGSRTLWNIPGGGYKPKRESAEGAALREVKEELGVSAIDIRQTGEYQTSGEGKRDTVTLFIATIANPDAISPNPEIEQVIWQDHRSAGKRPDVARVARRAIELAYER